MPTGTLPFASPEASRPRVFPVVRETQPAGLHIPGSTLHPPWPCEAKALRIPHIPSSPSASSSLRPFQGVPLPQRVSIFFNSRADPPRLLGNCRHPLADALSAPSRGNSVRFVGLCFLRFSTQGKKSVHLAALPHHSIPSTPLLAKSTFRLLLLHFGKSQGYSFRQNWCQSKSFLRQFRTAYPTKAVC